MKKPGTETESLHENVYGKTFSLYGKKDMEEFINPFEVRFERNRLNKKEIFQGMKCLDAGCGNGRGTIFMLLNGAAHVTAVDVSPSNIESTKRFVNEFRLPSVDTRIATLERLDFPDATFDFIWCNGVIMHTAHPNRCVSELSRVLKPGGKAWFYVYGSGGLYWRAIQKIRWYLKDCRVDSVTAFLQLLRYEPRYIGEFIDDWFASHLRTWTEKDFTKRLGEAGFENTNTLKRGVEYDTSERRHKYSSKDQLELMGEGDLRYLVTKKNEVKNSAGSIDEGEYGSQYAWPEIVTSVIDEPMKIIAEQTKSSSYLRIAAFAFFQRELRLLLNDSAEFSIGKLKKLFDTIHELTNEGSKMFQSKS
jgi:SAM-dependent methyltransferase